MKKCHNIFDPYPLLIYLLLIVSSCREIPSDNFPVSHVDIQQLNEKYLSIICKTWGLMKYYHPSVVDGKYDWDQELFNALNDIAESKSDSMFQLNLFNWIKSYDFIEKKGVPTLNQDSQKTAIKLTPNFKWIESCLISEESRSLLKSIAWTQSNKTSFYVKKTLAGGAQFTNEKVYENLSNPDLGFRLLTLFRYWNYIEYFYPYKYLIADWGRTLEEFIPMVYNSDNELEFRGILWKLFSEINDSHANLIVDSIWQNVKGTYYLPIKLSRIEGKTIITEVYDSKYLGEKFFLCGDEIIKVDEIEVDSLFSVSSPYIPASNQVTKYRDFLLDLLRSNKKELNVAYVRNGKLNSKRYSLKKIDENYFTNRLPVPKISFMDLDSIAYVNLTSRKVMNLPNLINKKTIIIDLRGSISDNIKNFLEMSDLIPYSVRFAISSEIDEYKPGRFIFNEHAATITTGKEAEFRGKIILLVNEFTQSQSEFMAMFYQSLPNSLTVGSQTAGTDGNMTFVNLPGGIRTAFTGVGVYYPDRSETQGKGIKIDKYVQQRFQDLIHGKDTQLNMVMQILNLNDRDI